VVGVFDTVPWEDTSQGMDSEMSKSIRINSNDGNIDFSLGVSDPPPGDPPPGGSPLGGPSSAITFSNDIRNHGLFVASLVYAVDPSSEIHLIRVLNNSGCGDLYTISKAIHGFVEWSDKNHFQKTVINLSLGVHVPHASRMINPDVLGALPPQVAALQTAIYEAFRFGAVIVAAAGNDSANLSDAQRMQLPAGYTLKTSAGYVKIVVGVAASNSNMEEVQRSCYSNRGDVAAPGGNGGDGFDEQGNPVSCVARASTWMETPEPCNAMINCGYGVVGLSVPTRENNFPIGLWSGTSFSTPLVTGLAALVLKANDIPNIKVNCVIERGATSSDEALGAGIINISESLGLDPNVACPP